MTAASKLLQQETARAAAYRQLAEAFRPPSPALPDVLGETASALALLASSAGSDAARLAADRYSEEILHTITIDHAALFVGPFHVPAPPYGSVYLEDKRQLMGASTMDVRQHYLSIGLDLSPDFKEAPDHLCAELEFMHVLVHQTLAAVEAGDRELLAANVRQQRTFLEKHLGAWVPAFADKVAEHARTDFYRLLASVLRIFVAEDREALPDLPVDHAAPAPAGA
ncbi:MAG: molecular chaperone TorD family protein [Desulfosarcina sp.]|nr:molecular chaperone TorD family protein [Desulfosarcina sp.]